MPVKFGDVFIHDANRILSLEDIYRMRAEFAGIHHFSFDSLVSDELLENTGDWEDPLGVWGFNGSAYASPTGSFDFAPLWHAVETPASFKLRAHMSYGASKTGIAFRGNGSDEYYVALLDWPDCGFYHVSPSGVETLIEMDTQTLILEGDVELSVYQHQYSEEDNDRFLFMSIWFNDRLILSGYHHIPDDVPGYRWGFAVPPGGDAKWGSVHIPDLCDTVLWASIDPGESALESLRRSVGERVITHFVRPDGSLRAFKPKATQLAYELPEDYVLSRSHGRDTREIISHVRLHYAAGWVDVFDPVLMEHFGHRFAEVQNPDISSAREAHTEASAALRRSLEAVDLYRADMERVGYFLEPGDHILLNGEHATVDSVAFQHNLAITTNVTARGYGFDAVPPTCVLATEATSPVSSAFEVTVTFSESVRGFVESDVSVSGASISGFSGSGNSYTFTVTPDESEEISISVPAGVAYDVVNNINEASNVLSLVYSS